MAVSSGKKGYLRRHTSISKTAPSGYVPLSTRPLGQFCYFVSLANIPFYLDDRRGRHFDIRKNIKALIGLRTTQYARLRVIFIFTLARVYHRF